jgi:hypothetical protein
VSLKSKSAAIPWRMRLDSFLSVLDLHSTWFLILITVLTFLLGTAVMILRPPAVSWGQTGTWWELALNLAHGEGYSLCVEVYFPFCTPDNALSAAREPAPVFLFSAIALLTHDSLPKVALVEILLHLLVLWGIFLLTKQWSNPHTALFAAALWAVYPPALRLIPQLSGELLATVGVTFGMYFFWRARAFGRTRDWLLTGLALGLGVMSRSAVLVIVAVLIIGLFFENRQSKQPLTAWLRPAGLTSLVVASMVVPWVVRNEIVLGKPVLGTTLSGYVIYRQNYMLGTPDYFHYVGSQEARQAFQALLAAHPEISGEPNEVQMDAFYMQEGIQVIKSYPLRYALLSAFRFIPLWFNWGIREAYGSPSNAFDYFIMALQLGLLTLAIAGIWGNLRRTWPLWASVSAFCVAYMAMNSQLRYLVPIMPLVISLGAAGGIKLFNHLVKRTVSLPDPNHETSR